MKRGDVWWVYLAGAEGSEQVGRRPAVVLQTDMQLVNASTILAAPITRTDRGWMAHIPLEREDSGLPARSLIMCDQVRALDSRRFRQGPIGRVKPDAQLRIDSALRYILGLE